MSVSETATGGRYRVEAISAGQELFEDLLRDRRGHCAAEAVQLLLEHDRDGDLWILGGREAHKPCRVDVIDGGFRRSGLAGHLDARNLGGRPGPGLDDA